MDCQEAEIAQLVKKQNHSGLGENIVDQSARVFRPQGADGRADQSPARGSPEQKPGAKACERQHTEPLSLVCLQPSGDHRTS